MAGFLFYDFHPTKYMLVNMLVGNLVITANICYLSSAIIILSVFSMLVEPLESLISHDHHVGLTIMPHYLLPYTKVFT